MSTMSGKTSSALEAHRSDRAVQPVRRARLPPTTANIRDLGSCPPAANRAQTNTQATAPASACSSSPYDPCRYPRTATGKEMLTKSAYRRVEVDILGGIEVVGGPPTRRGAAAMVGAMERR